MVADLQQLRSMGGRSRAVRCVETGVVYPSMVLAAAAAGESGTWKQNIYRACRKGVKCAGMHWQYVEDENGNPVPLMELPVDGATLRRPLTYDEKEVYALRRSRITSAADCCAHTCPSRTQAA
eukprot:g78655.t1